MEGHPNVLALTRPVKKTIFKKKPKTINADKNYSSNAIQKRITGLHGLNVPRQGFLQASRHLD